LNEFAKNFSLMNWSYLRYFE